MEEIVVKKLSCGYENKVIVKNISFTVSSGDYLLILGENGAGKSTIVKTLLGLIKPLSSNSIKFGDGITNKDIGYLPQQTVVQKDFPATVMEIAMSGFQGKMNLRPFYKKMEYDLCLENLKKLEILDQKNIPYKKLSGGQQQRVMLTRALNAGSKILLLDEPVSGLDPKGTVEMYKLIKSLNKVGTTIIMISHDIDALSFASHVLYIGDKTFFGSKEDFLNSDKGKELMMFRGEEK